MLDENNMCYFSVFYLFLSLITQLFFEVSDLIRCFILGVELFLLFVLWSIFTHYSLPNISPERYQEYWEQRKFP